MTFFLILLFTTLSLSPAINFFTSDSKKAMMIDGIDYSNILPESRTVWFIYRKTASSGNKLRTASTQSTLLPDASYYKAPQGPSFHYNHSEQATLQSFSAEDFRYIASQCSDINELLTDYELYAYPAFCEFARSLDCYPEFMIDLENKMMTDKSFKRQTSMIPGFEYKFWPFGEKSGFRDFVHAEVKRIKEEQRAAQERNDREKIKKIEKPEPEQRKKLEPEFQEQKTIFLDLGSSVDLELFTQECSGKIRALSEHNAPPAEMTKIADRKNAIEKTISNNFTVFDYSQDLDRCLAAYNPDYDDPYASVFKNCIGTDIDLQLHKELRHVRNTIFLLESHYTKSHQVALIGPAIHQLAAQAKTETDLREAFDLSDFCHTLSQYLETGMNTLVKGSAALGKGLYAGTCKTFTVDHAQDLALGIYNTAAAWALGALWIGEYGYAACSSALSLDLQPLHDKIAIDTELLKQHADQLSQSLQATYKKLAVMPWEELVESGSEIGIRIALDTLASGALGRFTNTAGKMLARDLAQAFNQGILFSKEYAIELAGLAKITIAEGLQSVTNIKNRINQIKPTFFTEKTSPQKWVYKKINNKQAKIKNDTFSQQAQAVNILYNHRRLVGMIRNVGDDILDYMEKLGGHTLSRHVGLTSEALNKRLQTGKKINASSSFYTKKVALKTTKEVLRKKAECITHWLYKEPHKDQLVLNLIHKHPIGHGLFLESSKLITNLTQSITVLERMPTSELGFKIVTIFPLVE